MRVTLRDRIPLLGLILAGTALRTVRLGTESLWYDETVSVTLAGSPLRELIRHTAGDIHPPGYYMLLRGWLCLAGYPDGRADPATYGLEHVSAFFSLFFGVLLIVLGYVLARRLTGRAVALVSAGLIAVSPYNVWYSQEVRMYTLGAVLAGLALYALVRTMTVESSSARRSRYGWWAVYALAAAAGMYALYYFAFFLVAINLWYAGRLVAGRRTKGRRTPGRPTGRPPYDDVSQTTGRRTKGRRTRRPYDDGTPGGGRPTVGRPADRPYEWIGANVLAAVLYAPWIPVALRQAFDPPVPPWRTGTPMLQAIGQGWTSLVAGQSAPSWAWPIVAAIIVVYGAGMGAIASRGRSKHRVGARVAAALAHPLFLATFGPFALILLASLATPLFHVRYLFTYSLPFYIVLSAGFVTIWRWRLVIGAVALAAWLVVCAFSLRAFWLDPAFRTDDHRAAVQYVQSRWRPGDVLLVNAGYAYPVLQTYWSGPIAGRTRLTEPLPSPRTDAELLVVTTGHVDGEPNLGWGDPLSDFYALPASVAHAASDGLFERFPRVWQYRVYDTVNDPVGRIRTDLDTAGRLIDDRVFTGEANLRVQAFVPRDQAMPTGVTPVARVGDGLALSVEPFAERSAGGDTLYVTLWWSVLADTSPNIATSIRLVDDTGELWSQPTDEQPIGELYRSSAWLTGTAVRQPLALPIPIGTPPGTYSIELVVYDLASGSPLLSTPAGAREASGGIDASDSTAPIRLGTMQVGSTVDPTVDQRAGAPLAAFGPLALLDASSPATRLSAGASIPVTLLWAAAEAPAEPYVIVLQLLGEDGGVAVSLEEEPLGGRYPTASWSAGEQIADRHSLAVPSDLAPGDYDLIVGVYRVADGLRLRMREGLFGSTDRYVIKTIRVE